MSLIQELTKLPKTDIGLPDVSGKLDIADLNAVTKESIDALIDKVVNKWDMKDFEWMDLKNLFSYEGFDPEEVYRHLIACRIQAKIEGEDFKKDIGIMIILQHIKGNISAANYKSLKPEAKNMVAMLFTRYKLKLVIGNDKKSAVTLPRIAAAFPLQSAIIAQNIRKDFPGPYDSIRLPSCMKNASFPSLIPLGEKSSIMLLAAYNSYATDQSIQLKKLNYVQLKPEDRDVIFMDQAKYTDISFQSPVMTTEGRKRAMIELKIGSYYKEIRNVVLKGPFKDRVVDEKTWDEDIATWKGDRFD